MTDLGVALCEDGRVTRRRACLLMGIAAPAVALLKASPARSAVVEASDVRFVVVDPRLQESLQFGGVVAERGCEVLEVTKGFTQWCQSRLVPAWRAGTGAVAGLTDRGVWECLAEQARSVGRRSRLVAHYEAGPDIDIGVRLVRMPRDLVASAGRLEGCGARWTRVTADLARQCAIDNATQAQHTVFYPLQHTARSTAQLVSWLIA